MADDYYAIQKYSSFYLAHYGIKGMKWGVRNDYVPTGQYRYIHRNRGVDAGKHLDKSGHGVRTQSKGQYATPQQRKIMTRIKVAKGAAIAAGTIMAAYGGYKWSQVLRSPAGQRMIANAKRQFMNKYYDYSFRARNVAKLTKQVAGTPMRMVRNTPAGRIARNVVGAPKRLIGGSRAGQIALKAYGAAVTVSDINSTQQWVRKMHRQGRVTRHDVGELAVDLINPLPNNIPGINRRKRKQIGGKRDE